MSAPERQSWQGVQEEVLRRIHARVWAPGEMIPNEQDLAEEFGCARATVNRALRGLSDAGWLERRRKAGTRVALHPVRKATLDIPMIRKEIEDKGEEYGYARLEFERFDAAPEALAGKPGMRKGDVVLAVKSLHKAGGRPFMVEDRWINITTVPEAAGESFAEISANEWLLTHAPYSRGEIAFTATGATAEEARHFNVAEGTALFAMDRITWDEARLITKVRQVFHPGYRMQTEL